MTTTVKGLICLPDETLVSILRYLHYKDLVSVCGACSRFNKLYEDDVLWRWQCQHYFLDDVCVEGRSWYEHFTHLYRQYGRYPNYRQFKVAWTKIETFLTKYCPRIMSTLYDGVSEECLDEKEADLGVKFPLDLRTMYRIRNGQDHTVTGSGLLGGGVVSTHVRVDYLLPLQYVAYWKTGPHGGCLKVGMDQHGSCIQMLALDRGWGFTPGSIYITIPDWDCFVTGTSLREWFCNYADNLEANAYYIHQQHIFRFYHEPSCVAVTNGITVKATTCLMPELCQLENHLYFFAYRIIMEMSADTPDEMSCQLATRHWTITDGNGKVEEVNGPGVIGEYPIMKPGKSFNWISCCTFDTPTGNMKGYFTFNNIHTGESINVECPCYYMEALPTLTLEQREHYRSKLAVTGCEDGVDH